MTQNGSIREKKWSKSKFEIFALPMGPWVPDLVIFCRFSKMKILSIFSTLADWICFILHILVVIIVLDHLTTTNYLSGSHNHAKCGKFCVKKIKNSIFDQFWDFDGLKKSNFWILMDSRSPKMWRSQVQSTRWWDSFVKNVAVLTNGEPTAEKIVRPLVSPTQNYHTSCHTILLIFG